MFDACLGLMLQVLNLLPQIPIDISFQTQIPLTITCCPEPPIYRRWHPEQGSVSPLCKEVRASHTLSKDLGRVTHQPSEGVDHPPSPASSDHSAGSGRLWGSRHQSLSHAQSITPVHSWQSGSVGSAAGHHSICSNTTEDGEVSSSESNPPMMREMVLEKMTMLKKTRVVSRPQVMDRWHQMAKKGRSALIPKTPSPTLARSSLDIRTQTQSLTPERKSSPSGESIAQKAPRRTALLKNPVNHLLRRSRQRTRHSAMRPGKKHGCLALQQDC